MYDINNILNARFYILSLHDFANPKVLHYYFNSRALAKYHLKLYFKPIDRKKFKVVAGSYIKKHNPPVTKAFKFHLRKNKHTKKKMSRIERLNKSVHIRRLLLRYNLHILQKPVGLITSKPPRIKWKTKKFKTPLPGPMVVTSLGLIQVDRYGEHRAFKILRLTPSPRKGILCHLETVCTNFKTRQIEFRVIRIKNIDVITTMPIRSYMLKCKRKNIPIHTDLWINYCKEYNIPYKTNIND